MGKQKNSDLLKVKVRVAISDGLPTGIPDGKTIAIQVMPRQKGLRLKSGQQLVTLHTIHYQERSYERQAVLYKNCPTALLETKIKIFLIQMPPETADNTLALAGELEEYLEAQTPPILRLLEYPDDEPAHLIGHLVSEG